MCAQDTKESMTGRLGGALKRIFVGGGRLRSGWRLVSYFVASRVLLVVLLIALGLGLAAILRTGFGEFAQGPMGLIVIETVQLIVTLATVFIWRRRLDRKSFVSLGLSRRGAVRDFLAGILACQQNALPFGVKRFCPPENDCLRVAIFDDLCSTVKFNVDNGKRGIAHLADAAIGQGFHHRFGNGIGIFVLLGEVKGKR